MKQLLSSVLTQIQETVPALKYVDENWGQLDYYGERPPVKFPCALVDIGSAQWQDTGTLAQIGIVQVRVVVATMKLTNTSGKAPQAQKDKAFEFFETLQNIHKALHGYQPAPHCGIITRRSCELLQNDLGIKMYELRFAVQINDKSAMPVHETVPKPTVRIITV